MNSNPVKVLDDLVKGIIGIGYDVAHLTILALAMPLSVLTGKWALTVRSVTKRLSAMTFLAIWGLLVVVSINGNAAHLASSVIGLPSTPSDVGQDLLPQWILQALIIAIVVDVCMRLACSRMSNRARQTLFANLGRLAVANIFIGFRLFVTVCEAYNPSLALCFCDDPPSKSEGHASARTVSASWCHIQGYLFPWLQAEVGPLTDNHKRVVTVLEMVRVEAFVQMRDGGPGRPLDDRHALARAFIAKSVLNLATTAALIERLHVDTTLRRLVGWERAADVPSEATFSRAFAEFPMSAFPSACMRH